MYDRKTFSPVNHIVNVFLILFVVSLLFSALFLTSCAGNKTEIAITGNSNTINTAATTEKKSDTKVDAAGSGYGDGR